MFTQEQLEIIKKAALKSTDEIAVFNKLFGNSHFAFHEMGIIEFCAQECARQKSGAESVYDMVNAWSWTSDWYDVTNKGNISPNVVSSIGTLVEPSDNKNGFRQTPVFVGSMFSSQEKMNWQRIPGAIEHLINSYYEGALNAFALREYTKKSGWWDKYHYYKKAQSDEDIFYYEFEEIHPFRDGNGRTGKILYNYLKGTLDNPQMPPNFWNIGNP